MVDVQNDFTDIPGAALPVVGGAAVAGRIREMLAAEADRYAAVVATRDWHIEPGDHFSATPDFIDSWPPHCVAGSPGADFHPSLATTPFAAVFSKGAYSASYTGFDGRADDGAGLGEWLTAHGIARVEVAGLATDHCVRATALDAAALGFDVRVRADLCAGVGRDSSARALAEMRAAGAAIIGAGA